MEARKRKRSRSPSPLSSDSDTKKFLVPPIDELPYMGHIEKFLQSKIREQNIAVRTLALKLVNIRNRTSYTGHVPPNLHKLLFTGTSGCGKTETARWVKHLFGMDYGYEYERQYIEVTKDRKEDEVIETVRPDANALIDRLNMALKYCGEDDEKRRCGVYPRFIMLLIDEIDSMDDAFVCNISSLLRSGCQTNSETKRSFQLPRETTLIIVFTANYGEEGIRLIPKPYIDNTAKLCVCEDMIQRGMSENTIRQMGDIVPFYPLNTETLKVILMGRLEQFIEESPLCAQFGEITYDGNVKNLLIDKVINLTEQGRGIRQGLGKLLENIGEFFETALYELHDKGHVVENVKNTLVVTLREIDLKNFDEQMEREWEPFLNDIMRSIMANPCLHGTISEYRTKEESVDTISMFMGSRNDSPHLTSTVLDMATGFATQQNSLFNSCFGTSPIQVVRLKEKNQELENTLDKVESLVNKNKNDPFFHQKVKDVVTKSKKTLSRYEDSTTKLLKWSTTPSPCSDESGESSPVITRCSVSSSSSSSSSSSFEEEKAMPTVIERVLAKYATTTRQELDELTLSSEVDQDSEEDRRLEQERNQRNDKRLFMKLMKKHAQKMRVCGECGLPKNAYSYNPRLCKSRIGKPAIISFRTLCNICRTK